MELNEIHDPEKVIQLLENYDEESRLLIERIYLNIPEENINSWNQKLEEQKARLKYFVNHAPIIKPLDADLESILSIIERIENIQQELRKSKPVRNMNKRFFSSYIYFLCSHLCSIINSGLAEHLVFENQLDTVMDRVQE